MFEILNNSWIIGIGTGVFSGVIATFITRKIFSKGDEREIAQKIESANREVLYALRPDISEGYTPNSKVLDALINSTARKYKLEAKRLYNQKAVAEELIKEIMDSSFISAETKKSYCESLNQLIPDEDINVSEVEEQKNNEKFVAKVEYREKMIMMFSVTIGLFTAFATLLSTLKSSSTGTIFSKVFYSLMPTFLVFGGFVFLINVILLAMKLRHKRLRQEYGIPQADDSNITKQSR
ncbi:hypothetical protein L4C39_19570 [Vibrio clamense]|uniref:hypothetical protein n=1 Tax=Vibrio clamense TaxID=2910254 RepID=UPI003D1AC3A0